MRSLRKWWRNLPARQEIMLMAMLTLVCIAFLLVLAEYTYWYAYLQSLREVKP